jgi:hypothetical protein
LAGIGTAHLSCSGWELCCGRPYVADAGSAGVGRQRNGSKPKSPEVILLREAQRTSGDFVEAAGIEPAQAFNRTRQSNQSSGRSRIDGAKWSRLARG